MGNSVKNGVCACADMTAEAVYAKLCVLLRYHLSGSKVRDHVEIQKLLVSSLRNESHKE